MKKIYWCSKQTEEKLEAEEAEGGEEEQQFIFLGGPEGPQMPNQHIDIMDNTIMFYGEVNDQNAMTLNKAIRGIDKDLQIFQVKYGAEPPPIKLYINSPGGSIFAGLSIVDTIKNSKIPVHTYIDGSACSAATLISCVASKRFMFEHSFMLIHQLRTGMWGKFEEFKDEMENLEMFMDRIRDIYLKNSKMSKKQVTDFLKREKYFDAKTCLELGLIDEIVTNG